MRHNVHAPSARFALGDLAVSLDSAVSLGIRNSRPRKIPRVETLEVSAPLQITQAVSNIKLPAKTAL